MIKLRNQDLLDRLNSIGQSSFTKSHVISMLEHHGIGNVSAEDREAMEMNWALKAYIKVAKKRLSDKVPMSLDHYFLKAFREKIKSELLSVDDAALERLLIESSSVIARRKVLSDQLLSLRKSKNEILVLGK